MNENDKKDWILSLLRQHESKLLHYVTRLLSDSEKAQEIVQESFLRLWNNKEWKKIRDYVVPWLFRVCRNLALDELRKDNPKMESIDSILSLPGNDPNPSETIETDQKINHLRKAIKLLTVREQEILNLKFQGDLSYKEIAEITGNTSTNVGFILHNALKKIKGILNTNDVFPKEI